MAQDALKEKDGLSNEWVASLGRGDKPRTLYIVATCLLAAIVPLILFAGMWVQSELHKNKRETEQFLRTRATQIANEVDVQMAQQFAMLGAVAALPSIEKADLSIFHEDGGADSIRDAAMVLSVPGGSGDGRAAGQHSGPTGDGSPEAG